MNSYEIECLWRILFFSTNLFFPEQYKIIISFCVYNLIVNNQNILSSFIFKVIGNIILMRNHRQQNGKFHLYFMAELPNKMIMVGQEGRKKIIVENGKALINN
jgi:hypothetical protein